MQKTEKYVLIGAGILALLLLASSSNASTAGGNLDISSLSNDYGADSVQRLNNLYAVLLQKGLTDQQILFMLSQALQETGLFTDSPNLYNVDTLHNYAGITTDRGYGVGATGLYAKYPNISTFVDDWITILNYNNDPFDASSISDYNNRLKANGYYTDSAGTYGSNLTYYYNLLNNTSNA